MCADCPAGRSSGVCTVCEGIPEWEAMTLKQKDDRVNCFACPKGTKGAQIIEEKAVYNDYRGDYESYKMYLDYPTFNLDERTIERLESDTRITCEFCPNGYYSDVEAAKTCTICPAGYESKKEEGSLRISECGERRTEKFLLLLLLLLLWEPIFFFVSHLFFKFLSFSFFFPFHTTRTVACEAGKFGWLVQGAARCDTCELAKFTTFKGSTECEDCPAGKFSDEASGTSANTDTEMCKDCPIGFFSDQPKSLSCTSCVSIGFINQQRDKKGVTLQTGSNNASHCVCPSFTIDLATIDPLADGNNDWHVSSDFTKSRCETRLRFTDKAICGSPEVCAMDVFSLIDNMAEQDIEFEPGNAQDCPARCTSPNTTGADLQLQPGWWRANQISLLFLDCKRDGTEFWREDCIGHPNGLNDENNNNTNSSTDTLSLEDGDGGGGGGGGDRRRRRQRQLVSLMNTTTNSTNGSLLMGLNLGCGLHTSGPMCRTCEAGYTRQGLTCKPCPTKSQRTLPISLVIIAVMSTCIMYTISMRKSWKAELASMKGIDNEEDDNDLNGKKGELEGELGLASDIKNGATELKKEGRNQAKDSEKLKKSSKVVTGAAISGSKAISATFNRAGGNGKSNPLAKIKTTTKQLLTFMQLSCSFMMTFDQIEWPITFKTISLSGAFSNLDFIAYLQGIDVPEYCSLTMPFLEQFWWHMLLVPILVTALFTMFMLNRVLCLMGGGSKKKKSGRIANTNTFWNFLNMILFLLYPGLAQRVFQVFKCTIVQEVPSVRIGLVQDLTIECHQDVHKFYIACATMFLILYVIGIPGFMFYILFTNRNEIHNKDSPKHQELAKRFGSLYDQYDEKWYFWELIETGRKALLTGALVVIAPGTSTQILVGIMLVLAHMILMLRAQPFKEGEELKKISFF